MPLGACTSPTPTSSGASRSLNKYDRATFYTQTPEGYTDYPFLEETQWGQDHAEELQRFVLP